MWFKIWRERAGVLAPEPTWVCMYGARIHMAGTLVGLFLDVVWNFRSDRRLVM